MPFIRFRLIIFIVSVILSSGLLWLGISRMPERVSGNYAALVFDEAVPDRTVRERLENLGFTGLISESGQYVLLDAFDGLEYVPLDEYEARILPFDPRNDGFAQKLRSLFVRDGKRYVYLSPGIIPDKMLDKIPASEFDDYPYSLEVLKSRRTAAFPLALFGIAVFAFFVIGPLRRGLSASLMFPCLPPLVPLATGAAAGFAMAALLAGLGVLLAGRFRPKERPLFGNRRSVTPPPSFVMRVLPPSLFFVCYAVLAFFSGLPLFLPVSVFCLFCGVFICSLCFADINGSGRVSPGRPSRHTRHRRFFPVQIIRRKEKSLSFAWAMLPFAVPALALAFTGFESSATSSSDFPFPPPGLISETDWQNHFNFQSNFSDTSLYDAGPFYEYEFSPDGLLTPIPQGGNAATPLPAPDTIIPPFPLGGFLSDFNAENIHLSPSRSGFAVYEFLCALVPLFFIVPAFIYRRRT